jgi:hypothetical protein
MRPMVAFAAAALACSARMQLARSFSLAGAGPQHRRLQQRLLAVAATTERVSADGASLDAQLVAKDPNLVLSHLRARRAGEDSMQAVTRIGGQLSCYLHFFSAVCLTPTFFSLLYLLKRSWVFDQIS